MMTRMPPNQMQTAQRLEIGCLSLQLTVLKMEIFLIHLVYSVLSKSQLIYGDMDEGASSSAGEEECQLVV